MKVKRIYLLPLPLLLAVALSGCHQGAGANTTVQDETGNGIEMVAGDIQIESVTIVSGAEPDSPGVVSAVIVNGGTDADRLRSITVNGRAAELDPADIEILPAGAVRVGGDADLTALVDLTGTGPGAFAEVAFLFRSSGEARSSVLVVPPVGFYESAAPKAQEPTEDGADE